MNNNIILTEVMPMLPLRGVTAFPETSLNFEVDRPMSVAALEKAMSSDRRIFLLSQKDPRIEAPNAKDLYTIGTVCVIKQILRLPQNALRVMVEGDSRARLVSILPEKTYFETRVEVIDKQQNSKLPGKAEVLLRQSYGMYNRYLELTSNPSPDSIASLSQSGDAGYVSDYLAQNLRLRHAEKQEILEVLSPAKRIEKVYKILQRELEILEVEAELRQKTQERMMQAQRDNILREQLKTIKTELGDFSEDSEELDEYNEKIHNLDAPEEVSKKLFKELNRLTKQPFGSAEASVIRNYLDICLELPWSKTTKEEVDVEKARKILDADHYGLQKVKDRISRVYSCKAAFS